MCEYHGKIDNDFSDDYFWITVTEFQKPFSQKSCSFIVHRIKMKQKKILQGYFDLAYVNLNNAFWKKKSKICFSNWFHTHTHIFTYLLNKCKKWSCLHEVQHWERDSQLCIC